MSLVQPDLLLIEIEILKLWFTLHKIKFLDCIPFFMPFSLLYLFSEKKWLELYLFADVYSSLSTRSLASSSDFLTNELCRILKFKNSDQAKVYLKRMTRTTPPQSPDTFHYRYLFLKCTIPFKIYYHNSTLPFENPARCHPIFVRHPSWHLVELI